MIKPFPTSSKLIIFIPCYNEEESLEAMLLELPTQLEGISQLEILLIDDGSTDRSVQIARSLGIAVLECPHQGLAQTYRVGLEVALERGADYLVSLEADAQYDPLALPTLLAPLLEGRADVVVAERDLQHLNSRSALHGILHRFGAFMVSSLTGLPSADPISGYRGYTRAAAQQLQIHRRFCPTLELWVQFARLELRFHTFPWPSRVTTRPSRLFNSVWQFVVHEAYTLLWSLWYYPKKNSVSSGNNIHSRKIP